MTDFPPETADVIRLHGLGLTTRIGVPESERATPQRLEADLELWPERPFRNLNDHLENTVNYAAVAEECREAAAKGERQLLETLAEELAALLLARHPLRAARVTLFKFILPDTRAVSVSVFRRRADFPERQPGF